MHFDREQQLMRIQQYRDQLEQIKDLGNKLKIKEPSKAELKKSMSKVKARKKKYERSAIDFEQQWNRHKRNKSSKVHLINNMSSRRVLLNAISPIQSIQFDPSTKNMLPFTNKNQKIDHRKLRFTSEMNNTFSNSNHNSRADLYINDSLDEDTVEIENQIENKLLDAAVKPK